MLIQTFGSHLLAVNQATQGLPQPWRGSDGCAGLWSMWSPGTSLPTCMQPQQQQPSHAAGAAEHATPHPRWWGMLGKQSWPHAAASITCMSSSMQHLKHGRSCGHVPLLLSACHSSRAKLLAGSSPHKCQARNAAILPGRRPGWGRQCFGLCFGLRLAGSKPGPSHSCAGFGPWCWPRPATHSKLYGTSVSLQCRVHAGC